MPLPVFTLAARILMSKADLNVCVAAHFHLKATDPATFATIAVLFFLIAVLASWLPAWRAASLDPTAALRDE